MTERCAPYITRRATIDDAASRVLALHRAGVGRVEAIRIVADEYGRTPDRVAEWVRDLHITADASPYRPKEDAPPPAEIVAWAAEVEADLRADGHADAAACAVAYDTDVANWRWGVAVSYGDPAVVFLAHNRADFRAQYQKETTSNARYCHAGPGPVEHRGSGTTDVHPAPPRRRRVQPPYAARRGDAAGDDRTC